MAGKFASRDAKLHFATSVGASIVIVGALFKILHLGGMWGSLMIGLGLGVEAFLFLLLGFFPPHPDLPWEKAYPELKEGAPARETPRGDGSTNSSALNALNDVVNKEIGAELIKELGVGLRTFGDKVAAISSTADAASATNEYAAKVKSATNSLGTMNAAFDSATEQLTELGASHADSKAYHDQVNNLAKNLSALNAVYELELQDSSAHLKSMNKFYQNLALTMDNFNESMEDSKQFKEEVGKLAKNLSSLNAIYGNMLTAMNQPRA